MATGKKVGRPKKVSTDNHAAIAAAVESQMNAEGIYKATHLAPGEFEKRWTDAAAKLKK
jgi:hypothetical protein